MLLEASSWRQSSYSGPLARAKEHDNAHVLPCENAVICRQDANQLQFNMHSTSVARCGHARCLGQGFRRQGSGLAATRHTL